MLDSAVNLVELSSIRKHNGDGLKEIKQSFEHHELVLWN